MGEPTTHLRKAAKTAGQAGLNFLASSFGRTRDRDRDRGFGCNAYLLRAIPSVWLLFVDIAFTRVDVGMERCNATSAATLRENVLGMASTIWTACSSVAMRSVQDPVVPPQGHVPWMRQAKGRETGRAHQRVVTDCGLATTGWRIPLGRQLTLSTSRKCSPGSCTGPAAAGTGKSIGAARSMHPHLAKRGAE